jgi:hypothetical protein
MKLVTQQESQIIHKKLPQIKALIELGQYMSSSPLAIQIDAKIRQDKELIKILGINPKNKQRNGSKSYCEFVLRFLGYHVTSKTLNFTQYQISQGVIPVSVKPPAPANTKADDILIDDNTAADPAIPFDIAPAGNTATAKKTTSKEKENTPAGDKQLGLGDYGIFNSTPGYKELVSNK